MHADAAQYTYNHHFIIKFIFYCVEIENSASASLFVKPSREMYIKGKAMLRNITFQIKDISHITLIEIA